MVILAAVSWIEDRVRTGKDMTARDWVDVVLRVVLAYPLLVLIMFVMRPFGSDIGPFEAALVGVGPALGVAIAERWRQNRVKDRNARLARGEAATIRGSFRGERGLHASRWRVCRFDLTEDSLRVRPLYYPRSSSWWWSFDSVQVLRVGRHQGWRRWILTGLKVVRCRDRQTTFELGVMNEDLSGLLSRLNGAEQ